MVCCALRHAVLRSGSTVLPGYLAYFRAVLCHEQNARNPHRSSGGRRWLVGGDRRDFTIMSGYA